MRYQCRAKRDDRSDAMENNNERKTLQSLLTTTNNRSSFSKIVESLFRRINRGKLNLSSLLNMQCFQVRLFSSMSNCLAMNFTQENAYYASKIQSEDKTWAWWLNNLGRNTHINLLNNQCRSFLGTLLVFIIGFCGNMLCLLILCRRRKYCQFD